MGNPRKTAKIWAIAAFALFSAESFGQATRNMTVLWTFKRPGITGANASAGIWGYTAPNGQEFALLTYRQPGGVSAVAFSATVAPVERGFVSGPNSIWHEVTSYRTTAYKISQEGTAGMQIINLAPLNTGGNIALLSSMPVNGYNVGHTLYVDSIANPARLYVTYGGAQGVVIYSLANPTAPAQIGLIPGEAHDIFARGDRLYISAQRRGFLEIWNVANPGTPARLGTINLAAQSRTLGEIAASAGTISHNSWPSPDNNYLFTTEEITGTTIKSWDIRNPAAPVYLGRYIGATNIIGHNVFINGKYMYVGHYTAGLRVVDITNPANMVEVAHHDGSSSTALYGGSWGVYPWFPSRLLIHGDDVAGLYVLDPAASVKDPTPVPALRNAISRRGFEILGSGAESLVLRLPGSGAFVLSLFDPSGRSISEFRGAGEGVQTLSLERGLSGKFVARLRQDGTESNGLFQIRN